MRLPDPHWHSFHTQASHGVNAQTMLPPPSKFLLCPATKSSPGDGELFEAVGFISSEVLKTPGAQNPQSNRPAFAAEKITNQRKNMLVCQRKTIVFPPQTASKDRKSGSKMLWGVNSSVTSAADSSEDIYLLISYIHFIH